MDVLSPFIPVLSFGFVIDSAGPGTKISVYFYFVDLQLQQNDKKCNNF